MWAQQGCQPTRCLLWFKLGRLGEESPKTTSGNPFTAGQPSLSFYTLKNEVNFGQCVASTLCIRIHKLSIE